MAEFLAEQWENFLGIVEPHLPEHLHWNEICWTFVYYLAEVRLFIHRRTRGLEHWEVVVNTVVYCLYVFGGLIGLYWLIKFLFFSREGLITRTKKSLFRVARRLPYVKTIIKKEMDKSMDDMETMAFPLKEGVTYQRELPAEGLSEEKLEVEVQKLLAMGDGGWSEGKVSGTVYHGGKELKDVLTKVYGQFAWSNPLHFDVFPGVRKMEAEVVRMCVTMFNGDDNCCGTMTGGGTESILMACKAYRDKATENGIAVPEIVAGVSVHAAFDKACQYFGMRLVHVPCDESTGRCDLKAMRKAINSRTCLIVGSAPSYAHGVIDDIEEMGKLALKYKLGLHVDSCLGGFLVPFMKKAGFNPRPFDFTVKGVSSISADTHKYGFSPKGSSVIMYNSKELRRYQYFVAPTWTGGIYASPAIPGSRPGGIVAATWASLMYTGLDGYVDSTRKIVTTRQEIESGLRKIKNIFVFGKPDVSVVAFGSDIFDIYRLSTEMNQRGWNLNSLQYPSGIHICLTLLHTKPGIAKKFVTDVADSVKEIMKAPGKKTTGVGAMYGMAQTVPDVSLVDELCHGFLDAYYSTKTNKAVPNGKGH